MAITALLLSRIQFGFTIGFHIIFPTLNLGLALFIAVMEGIWLKTQDEAYLRIAKFWTKIFALTFGMGVVSGIVLSYELGTNFAGFTDAVGGVLGSLFTYEVLSAFFLEAGFLGIMLFGWNRVGPKWHYAATLLVMIGTTISAFWILAANSWMQTPAGYTISAGKFIVTDWWQVVFNPSFIPRYIHMLLAAYNTACFVVAGVCGWHLLKGQHTATAKRAFKFVLAATFILTPLQIFMGDQVGIAVHQYQPLKTAAIEGLWRTADGAPLVLFGIPDEKNETNHYAITIPYGASLINTHHLKGQLIGLASVPPNDRPVMAGVFFSFRVMVGVGFLFLLTSWYALWLRFRKKLFDQPLFYRWCILISPLGFIASIAGWLTAELGRQPWVVYDQLRTANAASAVSVNQVAFSFSLFIIVYGIVFSFYLYYLFKLIHKGPDADPDKISAEPEKPYAGFQYMNKS